MKTQHAFRILIIAVVAILPLVAVAPVSAGGGTHVHYTYPFPLYIEWAAKINPCREFDIVIQREGFILVNAWYDENGLAVKEMEIWSFLTRTFTVGEKTVSFNIKGPVHYEYTYLSDTLLEIRMNGMGTGGLATVPGYGKIMGGAGLLIETIVYDISNPDKWKEISYSLDKDVGNYQDNWVILCEYLAP